MNIKEIFERTNQLISKILYYQVSAAILQKDNSSYQFVIFSTHNLSQNLIEEIVEAIKKRQNSSSEKIMINLEELTPETYIHPDGKNLSPAPLHLLHYLVSPLSIKNSSEGFMALFRSEVEFTDKDRDIFNNFTNYLGQYLEVEYQKEYYYSNFFNVIKAMSYAIEALDPFFHGHAVRVEELAFKVAEKLNFSEEMKDDLKYLSIVHDIGKVGLPVFILGKTGRLDKEEFEIVKEHTVIGEQILES
ncbi:HD domain-containing protein, partial [Candidatus Desantisbacteria bacterium]|nr:HD domain-containing protein [Candidatus Desantisbacteria bacterium]